MIDPARSRPPAAAYRSRARRTLPAAARRLATALAQLQAALAAEPQLSFLASELAALDACIQELHARGVRDGLLASRLQTQLDVVQRMFAMGRSLTSVSGSSPQRDVEEEHDDEAAHEARRADVLEAAAVGFGNDLVADHEQHGAGGEGQRPG